MSLENLLKRLASKAALVADVPSVPSRKIPTEQREAALVAVVPSVPSVPSQSSKGEAEKASDQTDDIAERAAIMQFDGGLSKDDAERCALIAAGACFCCHGAEWWVSRHGHIACWNCHAPAHPSYVAWRFSGKKEVIQ